MTSKNFNRVLTVVVNKLNKCYFNFTKPDDMKSETIEKSVFLVDHELGLEIDDCDKFLYITVDGARMYEIDLDNEVKDSNELFNRVQYLLTLVYGDVYNGNFDELVETDETEETEETEEVEEATTTRDAIETLPPHIYNITDINPVCMKCQDENLLPYNCNKCDMLDEKRQLYLQLYSEIQELIKDLHKCKSGRAYERRLAKMYIRNSELLNENKVSHDYINYVTRKISMCNVECGLWTSKVEEATGFHKSRRYNRHVLKY